jgi:tRNA A-37 threonylcarbamoyl transferase component Bud32
VAYDSKKNNTNPNAHQKIQQKKKAAEKKIKTMHSYNAKQLQKAGRNLKLPFCLYLKDSGKKIICTRLLRIIPKRRAVFLGQWGEKKVVAKLYYQSQHIKRHIHREVSGTTALKNAGIQTASLLFSGYTKESCIGILLFEYIDPALQFEQAFEQCSSIESKQALLENFVTIIASMHRNGLLQNDLHFNNFLVKNNTIFAIDAASINICSHQCPVDVDKGLKNLAVLFSQLKLADMHLAETVFNSYVKTLDLKPSEIMFKAFEHMIAHARKHNIKRYLKKIFRESTLHIHQHSFSRFMICRRSFYSPSMAAMLNDPDTTMAMSPWPELKKGNASTVSKININGTDLVIKRYNIKGFRHQLKRLFITTRAARSWENAHRLTALGIKTPMPVAFLEKRMGPFRGVAYYISTYVQGPDAAQFFATHNHELQKNVARRIARLFHTLKTARITHGDMKATNLIIVDQQPFLIDLDAMKTHINHKRFDKTHQKDLNRFKKNWRQVPYAASLFEKLPDHPVADV